MDIQEGKFVCLLKQSGCGKSTFLRLLAGLEVPTSGKILMDEKPVLGPGLDRGVVFQDYGLFPWMTAGENVFLALRQRYPKRDKGELKRIVLKMLDFGWAGGIGLQGPPERALRWDETALCHRPCLWYRSPRPVDG